jgi:Zn finger protein HypA/HybF involved in hydrogenase expression
VVPLVPGEAIKLILRVAGFGILILLVILGPIYKIFGVSSIEFPIAAVVCAIFIAWAYFAYKKLYSTVECPKCGTETTYQQMKQLGKCPKCGKPNQEK